MSQNPLKQDCQDLIKFMNELSDRMEIYLGTMPIIIHVLKSSKSSETQKKTAITHLEHINQQLAELYKEKI